MADKKFLVICIGGNREITAESEDEAWQIAIIRNWEPLFVKEAEDEKET